MSPVPNGPWPRAAKMSTPARLNMSLAGPTGRPSACSGDMKPGEPLITPVPVMEVASTAEEIPKSMILGPSGASSTLDGLRSRWMTPAAWIAFSPSASPAASASTAAAGSGPCRSTASASDMPGTYAVTSQGTGLSRSASTTCAVNRPPTLRAAATSRANRARNPASSASWGRITLTATWRPPGDRAR